MDFLYYSLSQGVKKCYNAPKLYCLMNLEAHVD